LVVPFSYVVDTGKRLAVGTLSGTVHGADIASGIRAVYEDPAWEPGFDSVWDATGIEQLLFEQGDLSRFVALHRDFAGHSGTGLEIIIVSRSLDLVMAKSYALMMRNEARQVRVCHSRTQAEELLGRPL
jgi:hypothetical protein